MNKSINKNKKILFLISCALLTLSITIIVLPPKKVAALSGSEFQAGRIIDDGVFFNPNSFDIQAFLNAKVPTCDTNGTQPYAGTTRAAYGSSKGYPPPYTCLKDYRQDTIAKPAEAGLCNGYSALSNQSAADIISGVAQSCGINPRVLVVLLQKEQALVTDDWPWAIQYRSATGYGCPDTAPCDAQYFGLFNQVYAAAHIYKYYSQNASSFNHLAYRNNSILYNPISSCGGSTVYIQNQATAGLYNYTPYQPNQSALDNLYGSGDNCGAYGNRNFWRLYNDWFGSTHTPTFNARFRAQSSSPYIYTGDSKTIYMQFTNTGSAFWKDDASKFPGYNPIHLATASPINRSSDFSSSSWLSSSRPNVTFTKVLEADGYTLSPDQHTVQPGQIGEYEFTLTIPLDYTGGVYREYFQPVVEGSVNYSMDTWTYLDIYVIKSVYDSGYSSQSTSPSIVSGDVKRMFLQLKNKGNVTWYDDSSVPIGKLPVHLAATGPINRQSIFSGNWPNRSRPGLTFTQVYEENGVTLASNQHIVQPGQIARYEFDIQSKSNQLPGTYREYFQPVLEGASNWSMGGVTYFDITIQPLFFSATYNALSGYPTISRGQSVQAFVQYKNTGNIFWKDDTNVFPGFHATRFATTNAINRISQFYASSWTGLSRPSGIFSKIYEIDGTTLASDQHTVQPGQIGRFDFTITAPIGIPVGTYREYFQPVLEGASNWNIGGWGYLDINVIP